MLAVYSFTVSTESEQENSNPLYESQVHTHTPGADLGIEKGGFEMQVRAKRARNF